MKRAYYPGCSPKSTTREADYVSRKVITRFGVELVELEGAACCGAGEIRSTHPDIFSSLNARTLAMAEKLGLDVITICATCQLNLAEVNKRIKEDQKVSDHVNQILSECDMKYGGGVEVKHLLWFLLDEIGPAKIVSEISRPLSSLRVAPFYGCHMLRPVELLGFDDPDSPTSLKRFIEICGAEAVDCDGKTKCCGFHNVASNSKLACQLTGSYLEEATAMQADCIVTPCPLCFTMFDGYQKESGKLLGKTFHIPVFHIAQLLGMAMGMTWRDLMLERHIISPKGLFEKLGWV